MSSLYALISQDTLDAVNSLIEERGWTDSCVTRVASAEQGPGLLDEAARVPSDLLLLDVSTGPGLAQAVLRYRLARPDTRVVLLAPGRKPGDAEVSAIVAVGVHDVVEDLEDLDDVLEHPRGLAAAARWLGGATGATVQPDTTSAGPARTRWGFWRRERPSQPAVTPPPDPLTGLPGREAAERALADSLPAGGAAVVFVNFDGFKQINDTKGHAEGDRVLREAARAMRRAVRRGDLLCRWGGDEFVLVLPGADLMTAQEAAERLREAVSGVTGASVGVAVSRPGDGVESLVARADQAMYADKRARRATKDDADDPWPIFRPASPSHPLTPPRPAPVDFERVMRGGIAAAGFAVSLLRFAVWAGALALLALMGLRLLALFNEMSNAWRVMLR